MKKTLIAALLCAIMTVSMVPMAFAADTNYTRCMAAINEQREVQAQAHQTANILRSKGYKDNSVYIQSAKGTWYEAESTVLAYQNLSRFTDEDIRILTTAVFNEAGHTTEQLRQYVAQVVLNRVDSNLFPDTVREVIVQPGQYSVKYADWATTQSIRDADAKNGTYYYAICENSVKQAMMGRVNMPKNVVFQANFTQGSGVWRAVNFNSGYFASTSYFCYL